jgi:type I restriction-modification system DNA methylase subunit
MYGNQNLNSNEIKTNAIKFAERHKNSQYERQSTHTFYDEFWRVFGRDRMSLATYEKEIKKNDSNGFIDVFWPGWLIIEQKSKGRDLEKAMKQASEYCLNLSEQKQPRYILACDFQTFHLVDRKERKDWEFNLSDLPENIQLFNFMRGLDEYEIIDNDPVNTDSAVMMGQIFDWLKNHRYKKHNSVILLTRLAYCFFADNTGIFEENSLQRYLKNKTSVDGSNLGRILSELFDILNQPVEKRMTTLDEELAKFPYINGNLFKVSIGTPAFDAEMRDLLIRASQFNWANVSPAIFGSMFESVMTSEERRNSGAHYTERENIMKIIKPLFLDNLINEFNAIMEIRTDHRKKELEKFHEKLSQLKFLDPACGSGNFLIIAYQELRRLELQVIRKLYDNPNKVLDVSVLSKIRIEQFYGIEIDEFSSHISEVSLWMMEHLMNQELAHSFGEVFIDIPLKTTPNITNKDALEIDWNEVLSSKECSFIMGNPPFKGSQLQTPQEKEQIKKLVGGERVDTLDYVCGWLLKSSQYADKNTSISFVTTNSITQGQQVGQLWPLLLDTYDLKLNFAYQQFKWKSEARGTAAVTVVILGFSKNNEKEKILFKIDGNKTTIEKHPYINPYLIGSSERLPFVKKSRSTINGLPEMKGGTMLIDNGNYLFTDTEKNEFLRTEPNSEFLFRPWLGADEFLQGRKRWILNVHNVEPSEFRNLPKTKNRIELVKHYRRNSSRPQTREISNTPTRYDTTVIPIDSFLVIPEHSSESYDYIPIGFMEPPIIPSNKVKIIEQASIELFGLLTSKMHMVWNEFIGGKLELRNIYSSGMVYNTFPIPDKKLDNLKIHAEKILDEREKHLSSTMAEMYNQTTMPPDLKRAHQNLDKVVDRLYRNESFESDYDRIEFLLSKYIKMIN